MRIQPLRLSRLRQSGELRVVLQKGTAYALLYRLTITDDELYCGIRDEGQGELLRSSYHGSGLRHTYVNNQRYRLINSPREGLLDFRGTLRLWSGKTDPEALSWDYRPKAESKKRRHLTIDLRMMPDLWSVDIWMVEQFRVDFLLDVFDSYGSDRQITSSVKLTSTTPWVCAIAHAPTEEALKALYDSRPTAAELAAAVPINGLMRWFPREHASQPPVSTTGRF